MAKKFKLINIRHEDLSYSQCKYIVVSEEMYKWRMSEENITEKEAITDELNCFYENYDKDKIWEIPENIN